MPNLNRKFLAGIPAAIEKVAAEVAADDSDAQLVTRLRRLVKDGRYSNAFIGSVVRHYLADRDDAATDISDGPPDQPPDLIGPERTN